MSWFQWLVCCFFSCIYFSLSLLRSFPHNIKLLKKVVIKQQPTVGDFLKGHPYLCILMRNLSCHRILRFFTTSLKLPLAKEVSFYWCAVCMYECKYLSLWKLQCSCQITLPKIPTLLLTLVPISILYYLWLTFS